MVKSKTSQPNDWQEIKLKVYNQYFSTEVKTSHELIHDLEFVWGLESGKEMKNLIISEFHFDLAQDVVQQFFKSKGENKVNSSFDKIVLFYLMNKDNAEQVNEFLSFIEEKDKQGYFTSPTIEEIQE